MAVENIAAMHTISILVINVQKYLSQLYISTKVKLISKLVQHIDFEFSVLPTFEYYSDFRFC